MLPSARIPHLCLGVTLVLPVYPQGKTGPAISYGPGNCIVANTGPNAVINAKCTAVDPKLYRQFKAIADATKQDANLLAQVLAELDSIAKRVTGQQSTTINNAPNGVANSGTIVVNPTVNNYAPQLNLTARQTHLADEDGFNHTLLQITANIAYQPVRLKITCLCEFTALTLHGMHMSVTAGVLKNNHHVVYVGAEMPPISPGADLFADLYSRQEIRIIEISQSPEISGLDVDMLPDRPGQPAPNLPPH